MFGSGSGFSFGSTPNNNNNKPAGSGLFGSTSTPATGGGLFGSTTTGASTPAQPTTGGLFGQSPSAAATAGAGATGSGFSFGTPAANTSTTGTTAAPSSGFSFGAKTVTTTPAVAATSTGATTSLFGSTPAAPSAGTGSLFGSTPAKPTTTTTTAATTGATPSLTGTGATPTPGGGGFFGAAAATMSTPAPAKPSFGGFGTPAATSAAPTTTQPALATPGPLQLADLGLKGGTPAKDAIAKPTTAITTTSFTAAGASNVPQATGSSGGIASLKNKTVGEILDKWNNELEVYSKEFHRIATQVMGWDRLLLENGYQIQNLYTEVKSAEKMQNEIDANLELIEAQQNELSSMLDLYEKNLDEIFAGSDGKPPLRLSSADQERENTFKLAEDLNQQMDDMAGQLKTIIEQVNKSRASSDSKGIVVPQETPIAQIITILNNHLISINSIDEETKNFSDMINEIENMSLNAKRDADRVHRSDGPMFGQSLFGGGSVLR